MKIAFGSDLHLEFCPLRDNIVLPDADILILAGDIMLVEQYKKKAYLQDFFEKIQSKYSRIIYVAGNHEYYKNEFYTTIKNLKEIFEGTNVHFLNNEAICIDDIVFFGGTMWTDFDNNNPFAKEIARTNMSNYHVIRHGGGYRKLRPKDTAIENLYFRDELTKTLSSLSPKQKLIVVSHHGPSVLSIDDYYVGDALNPAYVCDMSEYMLDNEQLKLWFHGHIHCEKDYQLGHTRVLCNPRGYPNEGDFDGFKIKTIEI